MIIIKYGGSILSTKNGYSQEALKGLVDLVNSTTDQMCLVIGGGKLCRNIQEASTDYLQQELNHSQLSLALDELGIAVTKINARYAKEHLIGHFGNKVCPELIIDPHHAPLPGYKVYLATGHVPGSSTDYDLMVLAKTLGADKAIKISDFPVVLDAKPTTFDVALIPTYKSLPTMTWPQMVELVGTVWEAGAHYPLDPKAAGLGLELSKQHPFTLLIGKYEQLENMIKGKTFVGTTVK